MPEAETTLLDLARAYSLSEVLSPDDPRLAELEERLEDLLRRGSGGLDLEVRTGGVRISASDADAPLVRRAPVGELARDLAGVGIIRLRISEGASGDDLRVFSARLRDATGAGVGIAGEEGAEEVRSLVDGVEGFEIEVSERGASASGIGGGVSALFAEGSDSTDAVEESFEGGADSELREGEIGAGEESELERLELERSEPGEGPEPDEPAASESDGAARPAFTALVSRYLSLEGAAREEAAARIRERAAGLRSDEEREALIGGLELLIGEGTERSEDPEEPLELARELADAGVVARLVSALGETREEEERSAKIEVIAALGGERVAPILSEALAETTDRSARRAYIEGMVALGEEALDEIEEMLSDSWWFVVRNGVAILGEIGGDRAVGHLTSALAHDDPRVRREAVMALARVGGEDAGILLQGMVDDPDPDVRAAVVMALGVLRVDRAVRPLLERLEAENDDDVVVQILRTLGQLGDPGAVGAIEKRATTSFFSRPPTEVRIAAYKALSDIGTPHALQLVEEAAEDRDPEVRRAVASIRRKEEDTKKEEDTEEE